MPPVEPHATRLKAGYRGQPSLPSLSVWQKVGVLRNYCHAQPQYSMLRWSPLLEYSACDVPPQDDMERGHGQTTQGGDRAGPQQDSQKPGGLGKSRQRILAIHIAVESHATRHEARNRMRGPCGGDQRVSTILDGLPQENSSHLLWQLRRIWAAGRQPQ